MADLDVSALQAIDVHVHVESDGHGQLSLDDELLAASAKYFKADNDRAPTVEQIADYYRQRQLAVPVRLDVHMHVDPLQGGKVEARHLMTPYTPGRRVARPA